MDRVRRLAVAGMVLWFVAVLAVLDVFKGNPTAYLVILVVAALAAAPLLCVFWRPFVSDKRPRE